MTEFEQSIPRTPHEMPGYDLPDYHRDDWVRIMRETHGLDADAPLEQVKPVALELLDNDNEYAAFEIVVNRRYADKDNLSEIFSPSDSALDKWDALLRYRQIEEASGRL